MTRFAACFFLLLAFSACSSSTSRSNDGGADSCTQPFTACGGSLVGSWQIQVSCYPSNTSQACPGPYTASYQMGYALTFSASGAYTLPESPFTEIDTFAASCFAGPNGASECTSSGACALDSDGSCGCQFTTTVAADQGTYSVSGSSYTITRPGNDATYSFCVRGNSLSVKAPNGTVSWYLKQGS